MLTDLGRAVLALGVLTYVGGWLLGARPIYVVAIGLLCAVVAASVWVRALARPATLSRRLPEGQRIDGDDIEVELDVTVEGLLAPGAVAVGERIARLGEQAIELRRDGDRYRGRYVLRDVPRGRYPVEAARVAIEDPFGIARREVALGTPTALLVYPRLVELAAVFTDSGRRLTDGKRILLRRPSGFDLHSVREHVRGESLRRVHWPSTARRARLMVKELEDAPRDESLVVLDAQAGAVVGEGRHTTFEVAVRAAGSLARAQVARGRRVGLQLNDAQRTYQAVQSLEGDWSRALELLACAEPDGRHRIAGLLADGSATAASNALDVVVVTWNLDARLADRLVQRVAGRRGTALVYVDPASFAGGRELPLDVRALLGRIGRAGVPVAVLRMGDDLEERLGLGVREVERPQPASRLRAVVGGR
jgi:uncharacterized protein (DUF58 family)